MASLAPELEKASISTELSSANDAAVEQKVTPWDVEGGYVDGKQAVSYTHLTLPTILLV